MSASWWHRSLQGFLATLQPCEFEKHVIDADTHEFPMLWWYRIIPYRSYVKGWKISPSHYLNQDLATVWLDK